MKGSDLNFLLQVKVTSQHLKVNNLNHIRRIPGIKPTDFMEVYGDSFVSGFIEGGEFTALLSIGVYSEDDISAVKLALQIAFEDLESEKNVDSHHEIQRLIDDRRAAISFR